MIPIDQLFDYWLINMFLRVFRLNERVTSILEHVGTILPRDFAVDDAYLKLSTYAQPMPALWPVIAQNPGLLIRFNAYISSPRTCGQPESRIAYCVRGVVANLMDVL
jgi:hypothetical protein